MKLTLLPFVFLCSCTTKKLKEDPACIFDDYMFMAPKVSEEKVFNDFLLQNVVENLQFFTDEEILQHFLLHDPTFVDPPVTRVGDE